MSLEERRRRNGLIVKTPRRAREAVLANEGWFGDGAHLGGTEP